ncbi:hypothetical protein Tco_0382335 [Tanacetum coccineum]
MMKCHKMQSKFVRSLTCEASILWDRSRLYEGTSIYSWPSITCQNGLKQRRSPPMTPELFANFSNLSSPELELPVPSLVIAVPIFAMTSFQRIVPDFEDSRARGFVPRSLGLHILSFIWESDILDLFD